MSRGTLRPDLHRRPTGRGDTREAAGRRSCPGRRGACQGALRSHAPDAGRSAARGGGAVRVRPLLDRWAFAEPRLAPPEGAALPRHRSLQARRQAGHVLPHRRRALAPLGVVLGEAKSVGAGMSRPKKMLPVLGQASQEPEGGQPESAHAEADGCTDDCCSGAEAVEPSASTPRTRMANPEALEGGAKLGVLGRTVVRVEGMDCASCAATVEKRVRRCPACTGRP